MPSRHLAPRPAVLLPALPVLLALALVACLGVVTPAPAEAAGSKAEPHRPLPGYRPAFVTETDQAPPLKDCLWATGAMLVDKWTAGEIRIDRRKLRRLSGDLRGGSSFRDLDRAFARLGLDLEWSPDGGRFTTWAGLLKRLREGGGAILLGDYGDLPRAYGRWDLSFWRNEGEKDNHALYLDRYDRKRHAVWVMDPLGRGDWDGEWIPVTYLQRYAWRTGGGGLWVAMTPRAEPAPFDGVSIEEPTAATSRAAVTVDWRLGAQPDGWRYPGADLHVDVTRLESGLVPASADVLQAAAAPPAAAPAVDGLAGDGTNPSGPSGAAAAAVPAKPTIAGLPDLLRATVPLPGEPGVYRIRLRVTERRFGHTVAAAGPYVVFVPGERQAGIAFRLAGEAGAATSAASATAASRPVVEAGAQLNLGALVANRGVATWADPVVEPGAGAPAPLRRTALWAHWVADDPELAVDAPSAARLVPIAIAPGEERLLWLSVRAPATPGAWTLVLDPGDMVDGSFAASGNRPASIAIRVVAPASLLGLPRP